MNNILDHEEKLYDHCKNIECLPDCLQNLFNLKIYYSDFVENSSLINIFPIEKPHIKYIYSQKIDLHQLFHQIGGTLCFWFGLSCYTIIIQLTFIFHNAKHKIFASSFARHLINKNNNSIEEFISMKDKV